MSGFIQRSRRNKVTLDKNFQRVKDRVGAIKRPDRRNKRTGRFRNFTSVGQNKREREPKYYPLSKGCKRQVQYQFVVLCQETQRHDENCIAVISWLPVA